MSETLVRAAVLVLSKDAGTNPSGKDPGAALSQNVSHFLESVQHFPSDEPLPFALEVYRDFFVLVAQWRNQELSIDARHTIDSTRAWLDAATHLHIDALDRDLVSEPWFWGGPCDLTCKFLCALEALHAGQDCVDAIAETARSLVDSLEAAAAENASDDPHLGATMLSLLGIVLDAFAELNWADPEAGSGASFESRAARLLVEMVWRTEQEAKVAAGILDRLKARGGEFGFEVAAEIASAVVARVAEEVHHSFQVEGDGPLIGIEATFRSCLDAMLALDEAKAIETIDLELLKPLSSLLSTILERTSVGSSYDFLAELDTVATRLFDLCCEAVQRHTA